MSVVSRTIRTSHADIAISETSGRKLPVLLIHGNSASKQCFGKQLESDLGEAFRLIAVDLPGHGESSDAFDPKRTYTLPGYADAMVELLAALAIERAAVLGWSLGGHVALELLPRFPGLVGVMIAGAPPVGRTPEEILAGFRPNPDVALTGKPDLTREDVETFARAIFGEPVDEAMRQAVVRADGRARATMFASLFAGEVSDERALAINSAVPIAVVNGADDPLVNVEYVGGLSYRNLWDKHCFVLRGAGHAPFLRTPAAFNAIFLRFLNDMAKRGDRPEARKSSATAAA
ncbi:MAG: alpha/beta hydrolase [Bauldia sp.]